MTVDKADILEKAEAMLKHSFHDRDLLIEALTHSSAATDVLSSNERMEFLGDSVLELVICDRLYHDHKSLREGDLTTMKSSIVSRRTCSQVARQTGLIDLLLVGKGIINRRQIPSSLAANVYESIVAALYLDGGYDVAKRYILETMGPHIAAAAGSEHGDNYKAMLQQYAQRELQTVPRYELLDEKGPDHSKCFEVGVTIGQEQFEGAWGPNKKVAEQKAAIEALYDLEVLSDVERGEALGQVDHLMPQELEA
jgi:ribonuclease-3